MTLEHQHQGSSLGAYLTDVEAVLAGLEHRQVISRICKRWPVRFGTGGTGTLF